MVSPQIWVGDSPHLPRYGFVNLIWLNHLGVHMSPPFWETGMNTLNWRVFWYYSWTTPCTVFHGSVSLGRNNGATAVRWLVVNPKYTFNFFFICQSLTSQSSLGNQKTYFNADVSTVSATIIETTTGIIFAEINSTILKQ